MHVEARGDVLAVRPLSRRRFLKLVPAGMSFGLMPRPVRGYQADTAERSLSLYNYHTGEQSKNIYWADGDYIPEVLQQFNNLLRDHRANETTEIDPKLFDFLYTIGQKIESRHPFHIVSAYRCPETNARLRRRRKGVSKNSFHMYGKAVDLYVPGYKLGSVRRAALTLRCGGVGYYPRSKFIHLDTGPVRSW
jgi:uncharacterized protein YcbK (DUF882 family)